MGFGYIIKGQDFNNLEILSFYICIIRGTEKKYSRCPLRGG